MVVGVNCGWGVNGRAAPQASVGCHQTYFCTNKYKLFSWQSKQKAFFPLLLSLGSSHK